MNKSSEEIIIEGKELHLMENDINYATDFNDGLWEKGNISNLTLDLQQSTIINLSITISDSVLSPGSGVHSPTGKFNVLVAIYDDSKTYSGKDFGVAVLSDISGYSVGNAVGGLQGAVISANNTKNDPILVVYGTYVGINTIGGVLGDAFSNNLKNRLAKTDIEKRLKE